MLGQALIARFMGCQRMLLPAVMVGLWLGTMVLGVSPELHALIHHDAQQTGHECLVTLLSHHQVLATATVVLLPMVRFFWQSIRLPDTACLASRLDLRLSPERAPPPLLFHR